MDFKLDFGPWKTVYKGIFQGHEVEVVSNPEHFFLVFIYEKNEEGENVGALVEGYKAMVAHGPMENFIETLPKPSLGITKSLGEKNVKILFISFSPLYVDFREEDFLRKVDNTIQKTFDSVNTMSDLARASSLELKELNMSPESEYSVVLGDPFLIRALVGGAGKREKREEEEKMVSSGIQLGLNKSREKLTESTENLKRSIIFSEKKGEQEYAQYIISENFLLENKPLVIFDSDGFFSGLKDASQNHKSLRDSLVEYGPIGFPTKQLAAKEDIKISLKNVDLGLLLKMLGTGDEEFNKKLILAKAPLNADTPEGLAQQFGESEQLSDFEKLKAERICMVAKHQFRGMFGESPNPKELTRDWPGNLGRATIISMEGLEPHERELFVQTILRLFSRQLEETEEAEFIFVIPEADRLTATNTEKASKIMLDLENKGAGFILGASRKGFNADIEKSTKTKITVVSGNDAAINTEGGRHYRVLFRPSLSGNPSY